MDAIRTAPSRSLSCLAFTSIVVEALRATATREDVVTLVDAVAGEMDFRCYALIHHDDLRGIATRSGRSQGLSAVITEHLIGQHRYRRDPSIRGCVFADSAFLWSELFAGMSMGKTLKSRQTGSKPPGAEIGDVLHIHA